MSSAAASGAKNEPARRPEAEGRSEAEIAARLAAIWRDLLSVEALDHGDNYFDLGGDSSLAVQLFVQIERAFGVKLPLASLFDAPTVGELAALIHRHAPANAWSPLVAIQTGGNRPPLFLIHGAGGNVLIYRELALRLGSDQPIYGLQSQGLDGASPPLATVEAMARLYIKEMQRAQRHGPYYLGGYCGGGTVAYECAQQLRAAGEPVALLALFDTSNWCLMRPASVWDRLVHAGEQIGFHAANLIRLDAAGRHRFLRAKLRDLRQRLPVWWGRWTAAARRGANSQAQALADVWRANDRAGLCYIPRPYPGVVTDFRPARQYRRVNQPGLKWDTLAGGGQIVVTLPVDPAGMLVEPFVAHLAEALRQAMDRAIRAQARAANSTAAAV